MGDVRGSGDHSPASGSHEDDRDRMRADERRTFLRPEGEDDDGYDPYSDRPPEREPLFERDPWG